MKYREVLAEVQPHYAGAIIAAIVALAGTAASTAANASAQKKAKRSAANASQLAAQGGANSPFAPTATRFEKQLPSGGSDQMTRLGDLGKAPIEQKIPNAMDTSQGAPPAVGEDASGIKEQMRRQEEERKRLMMMGQM